MKYKCDWRGYKIYDPPGIDPDPNVLVVVDQDGNMAWFDAGDRYWENFPDLLALLVDDLEHDRLTWERSQ